MTPPPSPHKNVSITHHTYLIIEEVYGMDIQFEGKCLEKRNIVGQHLKEKAAQDICFHWQQVNVSEW